MFRKILDKFPGILLAAILLVVIGIFVVSVQPGKSTPAPINSARLTPTPETASTIDGIVVFDCQSQPCTKAFSAFDIAAYAENQTSPIAQSSIDPAGRFTMRLPAGHYVIKTIPQAGDSVTVNAVSDKSTSITLHIKIANRAP